MKKLKRKIMFAFAALLLAASLLTFIFVGVYTAFTAVVSGAGEYSGGNNPKGNQIYYAATDGDTKSLLDTALTFLGTPYEFGASSRESADCSGFILQVYSLSGTGITLPHFAADQAMFGTIVYDAILPGDNLTQFAYMFATEDWNHAGVTPDPGPLAVGFMDALGNLTVLQPGDLMFFDFGRATKEGEDIGHVAMYLGNGQFIHTANTTENCVIRSLYTLKSDGLIIWSSYANSCIKITHLLDKDSSQALVSDLKGGPLNSITANDAYALGFYLQQTFPKDTSRTQFEKAVEIINLARANQSSISQEVTNILKVYKTEDGIDPVIQRNVRLAIIGTYWEPTTPIRTNMDAPDLSGYVIVLDPGHQMSGNSNQEPVAPLSTETKDKCSSGTSGSATGRYEYVVNLEIGLVVKSYLESCGAIVYMTRTTNDVDLSNIERAKIAEGFSPDAYIRLHCDSNADSSVSGIGVFVADSGVYKDSMVSWGDLLGSNIAESTGATFRGTKATAEYSGLNWAADIPSFLLEMGFMSNRTEDKNLSDSAYQIKICEGIAIFVSQMPKASGTA